MGARAPDIRSASAIGASVASGERSAVEAVRGALAALDARDPALHAFLDVFPEDALAQAGRLDARRAQGERLGPLAGVPIAVKDNICYAHGRTTCASRMLEHYRSPYTATALQRLIDAGAIVIGKTNLDEFAMGSSCEHSAFGPTHNPWDASRVPGGSSGGSAAAVAAGIVPLALGSDTGGSIRQPAALCGVVGLKPTYGRVSRYGLVAYASSLDQIGPLARTLDDCAACLGAMAGRDPLDTTSSARPFHPSASPDTSAGPATLGVPRAALDSSNDPDALAVFKSAAGALERAGFAIREIDLPHSDHAVAAYYIVATAEASSNLARYDGVRYGRRARLAQGEGLAELYSRTRAEGFGHEVQRRIMLGTHVLSSGYYDAYYLTALKARRMIQRDFDSAFLGGCDAVLMPVTTGPAFRLGEKLADPLALYLEDVYTVGVNLAGLPALALPAGFVERGGARLPIGLQLVAPAWCEAELLRLGRRVEQVLGLGEPIAGL
ncbi:MAG TPA: Asp-tRNA(Asn)/Glu-tRNA(Gln) amidotransferase subunit GatA [Phycisphaerales bacterium]|nr:Asp-tRNA(Asn)/Glu-tRNA(Gln) amidotransferase subunit GatA [Phycisphaerales bacterium]